MSIERLTFGDANFNYHPLESAIHVARYELAKPYVKGKKVLDCACGEGYGSFLLKKWGASSVVGVDISDQAILKAKKLFFDNDITFMLSSAEDFSTDNKFDLIISLETIEHVSNPQKYLNNLKESLAPGGILIISCPNDHFYYKQHESNEYHLRKYTFESFAEDTEKVLGTAKDWLIGGQIFGHANFKLDQKKEIIVSKNKKEMIDIVKQENAKGSVSYGWENYTPNILQCSYYVGIWSDLPLEAPAILGFNAFPIVPIKVPIESVDELYQWAQNLNTDNKKLSISNEEAWHRLDECEKRLFAYESSRLVRYASKIAKSIRKFKKRFILH